MPGMAHPMWPVYDLRLRAAVPAVCSLEIRLPGEAELPGFLALARAGIHPPDEMPFGIAWTDVPSPDFERGFFQFHMRTRASWTPTDWQYTGGVWVDGEPAGFQDLVAVNFAVMRTVGTGSWLGQRFQGRGIGRLMRTMILALAFDGLGAEVAESSAMIDNPASNRVSEALGYERNGLGRLAPRGVPRTAQKYRLTLEGWRGQSRPPVEIDGLEGCRELFGA
jgi:RimJ/RimL family protein N-acetyltransferase